MKDKFDEFQIPLRDGANAMKEVLEKNEGREICTGLLHSINFFENCVIEILEDRILENPEKSDSLKKDLLVLDEAVHVLKMIFEKQVLLAYASSLEEEIEQLTNLKEKKKWLKKKKL